MNVHESVLFTVVCVWDADVLWVVVVVVVVVASAAAGFSGVANLLHLLSSAKGDDILKEESRHFGGDLKKAKAIMVFQVCFGCSSV